MIKNKAISLGFDLAGITTAAPISETDSSALRRWLNTGFAGSMDYMHRNFDKRTNPAALMNSSRSVICVGLNYKPASINTGAIADYALYEDYHIFIKHRLWAMAAFIKNEIAPDSKFKACVDSAPLAERALAARAGLGFIGKNHMLINPMYGAKILLGQLITSLELRQDEPMEESCGDCAKCLNACPGSAITTEGCFDARRCISFLTIEHKGGIPTEFAEKNDFNLFGCDRCITVCPYQKKAKVHKNKDFKFFPQRCSIKPEDVISWEETDFEKNFAGSAVERISLVKLKRNAQICLKNQNPPNNADADQHCV